MHHFLRRDAPILIIETGSKEVEENLKAVGYAFHRFDGFPNSDVYFMARSGRLAVWVSGAGPRRDAAGELKEE